MNALLTAKFIMILSGNFFPSSASLTPEWQSNLERCQWDEATALYKQRFNE